MNELHLLKLLLVEHVFVCICVKEDSGDGVPPLIEEFCVIHMGVHQLVNDMQFKVVFLTIDGVLAGRVEVELDASSRKLSVSLWVKKVDCAGR